MQARVFSALFIERKGGKARKGDSCYSCSSDQIFSNFSSANDYKVKYNWGFCFVSFFFPYPKFILFSMYYVWFIWSPFSEKWGIFVTTLEVYFHPTALHLFVLHYVTQILIYLAKSIKLKTPVMTLQITLNYRAITKWTQMHDWLKPEEHGNLDRPYEETGKLTFQPKNSWNLQIYWKPWTALCIDLENTVEGSAGKPYGLCGAKCCLLIKHTPEKSYLQLFSMLCEPFFLPFIDCLFWKNQQSHKTLLLMYQCQTRVIYEVSITLTNYSCTLSFNLVL